MVTETDQKWLGDRMRGVEKRYHKGVPEKSGEINIFTILIMVMVSQIYTHMSKLIKLCSLLNVNYIDIYQCHIDIVNNI